MTDDCKAPQCSSFFISLDEGLGLNRQAYADRGGPRLVQAAPGRPKDKSAVAVLDGARVVREDAVALVEG